MRDPGSRFHPIGRCRLSTLRLALCAWALLLGAYAVGMALAQDRAKVVYVATIDGMIDLGLAPYVARVLAEAKDANAAAVVLDINTFGGRVDGAVMIRDALLAAEVPTIAFVNPRAISAGALISLAAERIVMATGATIGAAAPVMSGQSGAPPQAASEKTVSYVRKEFRATAEARKRPPLVAEAMVDADVEIPDVVAKGKLLTLTTDEALALKIADARAPTLQALLQQSGLADATLRTVPANWAEHVVRWLTHPVVSSLLLTLAMVGIVVELRTPGFGVPGTIGILCLGLFFWGHWLVQLAGWEEMLLVVAGIVLLGVEVFLIPGFGVVGALGIAALLAGLVLSLIGSGASSQFVMLALARVGASLAVALIASFVLLRYLPRSRFGRTLILDTQLDTGHGYASAPLGDAALLGRTGRAVTPLHPAGIASFDGERVDVVSRGDHIAAGSVVEVVRVDGNRVVVERRQNDNNEESAS